MSISALSHHFPALARPRRRAAMLAVFCLLLLLGASAALAQSDELTLSLRRDFGYGGPGGQIQGTFSFRAEGPDDLAAVDFFIDDQLIGTDTEPPWRYQFKTDDYGLGAHQLHAVGSTASGEQITSNVLTREFVPASEGWKMALRIAVPLILIALAIPILAYVRDRRSGKGGGPEYGLWGGAVCPKCGYPFARHGWAPNLGVAKYDRCPHCGKWSAVRRASAEELRRAEDAYGLEEATTPEIASAESEEESLRRRLDESRYDDG